MLSDKYSRTFGERTLKIMKKNIFFKMDGNVESLIDRYDRIINDVKKVDLTNNLMYALTVQFVDRLEKSGLINNEEKQWLKDQIETKGGPRAGDVVESMRRELKRLNIVDNREEMWKGREHSTYYVQNQDMRSRYHK